MSRKPACVTLTLLFAFSVIGSADAQTLILGGAVDKNIQRFDGDATLNRLDGEPNGWMAIGAARIGPWILRGEASRDATVRSVETTSLTVNAHPVTIRSELSYEASEIAVLGGYARDINKRVELAALGGVSFVTVHRSFTTDAGAVILIPPSTVPAAATTTTYLDRFPAWTLEGTVSVRLLHHLAAIGGIRAQPIRLKDDLSGRSLRTLVGAAWRPQ